MAWDDYNFIQRLSIEPTADRLRTLRARLDEARTLDIPANRGGLYSASQVPKDHASGYQDVWLRDNVMVAFSKWFCGNTLSAKTTVNGLQELLKSQAKCFEDIIGDSTLKESVSRRPRVRFNSEDPFKTEKPWANAQNDALGAILWLRFLMANQEQQESEISVEEFTLYERLLKYFKAIQYWSDADSGSWEEERKVNSSSVGAVLAGVSQVLRYSKQHASPKDSQLESLADELDQAGRAALKEFLPFESPPKRKADSALLFLIFPFEVIDDLETQNEILALVRARLVGAKGVRRYIGDSYYCQDYDDWFPSAASTGDFSENMTFRDELLVPGQEAQWCIFDPLLSAIYGRKYQKDRSEKSRRLQVTYFQRSIRQLTKDLQCPELYYLRDTDWNPNDHTPLAWTQANLAIALRLMEQTTK